MLRKLGFFKSCYESGGVIASVQEDRELTGRTLELAQGYYEKALPGARVESGYSGSGVAGGRGAFAFILHTDGGDRFLKINIPRSGGKEILRREQEILARLLGEDSVSFCELSEEQGALSMKLLERLKEGLTPEQAEGLLSRTLERIDLSRRSWEELYDITDILAAAREGLPILASKGLIGGEEKRLAEELFSELDIIFKNEPRVLCHGDFGDMNVMTDGGEPVLIDWEDAFKGVRGYDMLYWLTFFSHRKYYTKELFGSSSAERRRNIALTVMILAVKETMAVYNGEYLKNSLTAGDRIKEIVQFL
ncbi:MAG: aminoglycoside phosphotransferase family protein [Ruminococcus sp.]|nr:aminoglycoside phosphotransferase family protein [Ruminococcus sp.]